MKKLCIRKKRSFNFWKDSPIIAAENTFVKENCGSFRCRGCPVQLLLAEGHAVGALVHGGIHLMGANQNLVQGAVVLMAAMVGTLLDGAFDALVCVTVHKKASFEFGFGSSMRSRLKTIQGISSKVAFSGLI